MVISPLIFEPILKPKVWGGRRLSTLGKPLPPDQPIGESWECADLPDVQSSVARGPYRGQRLHDLVEQWGVKLLGRADAAEGRFPLLLKFLDICEPLSVQVHPDATACARHRLTVPPKNEAWYVVEASSDARIYRGLRMGVTREDLARIAEKHPEKILEAMDSIQPRAGDAYYLPAGTIHAASGEMLIAEIQTPCDVTYRLFDWNRQRPGADSGLHLAEALDCLNTDVEFSLQERRSHVTSIFTTVTRLVNCPSFRVEKVRFIEGIEQEIPYAELVCWMVLSGQGEVHYDRSQRESFTTGDVVILPAGLQNAKLKTQSACTWLEITIPIESDLSGLPHPNAADLRDPPDSKFVPLNIGLPRRDQSQAQPNQE